MAKQKQKYYVVWKGKETGVFDSWEECKRQIHGIEGAEYKSFTSRTAAEQAFEKPSKEFIGKDSPSLSLPPKESAAELLRESRTKGKGEKHGYMMADPMLYNLLKNFSEEHRKNPTEAENILWLCLKGGQLDEFHFRRQHIIGKYIADFVCLEKMLVIEIDGLVHQLPDNKESDEERTRWLNTHGFTVIRFKNEEIICDIENVLRKTKDKLKVLPFGKDLGWAWGYPILESICVDAAYNGDVMEYRGVYTKTKKELFKSATFEDATNNIGEFLAIVHALALLKKQTPLPSGGHARGRTRKARVGGGLPVYSDSLTAMSWVKNKHAKTKLIASPANKTLFYLIGRAQKWLKENKYPNRLLKWETRAWGENPADFGRK